MSSWHTPEDPREYTDPPVEATCDLCGIGRVYIAAEDWSDTEDYYCVACVQRVVRDRGWLRPWCDGDTDEACRPPQVDATV